MYLIAIAWVYVVLMMAVAEATSSQGSLLGAFFTLLLYGVLPLSIVLYIVGTPGRKRLRQLREAQHAEDPLAPSAPASDAPDGHSVTAGDAVTPVRKEV